MKVSEKLAQAHSVAYPPPATFSFEFFVPKTSQGVQNLYDRMDRMYELNPIFVDITWNAGGTTSTLTNDMVLTAQSALGLETCMHLTCTNMAIELLDEALDKAYLSGCQNILALRGDPPLDGSESTGHFKYAKDLILHIRKRFGDHFNIGVAAYPECHPEDKTVDQLLRYLKEKVDSGADFIITQMFYDADNFIAWCTKVREIGVDVPIIPGIMPISTYASFMRRAKWSNVKIPEHFLAALEPIKDDDYEVRQVGSELVSELCQKLIDSKYVNHLHFYTMNLERSTLMVLEHLDLIEPVKSIGNLGDANLPWRKSLHPLRSKEAIRPIFWLNRKHSYISRTSTWDEFPNGRWGDSRSPAFGDIDLCASASLRQSPKKAIELWGLPSSLREFSEIIISYLKGGMQSLPWSDGPVGEDTSVITNDLLELNRMGFFTLNSQPALCTVSSSDKVHGWGPKNGYVYQKQYLEFLCRKDSIPGLINTINEYNNSKGDTFTGVISYYAVDKDENLITNCKDDDINAVTWGVFPGEEILQPTIVEKTSFLAWKDEVYRLFDEWAAIIQSERGPQESVDLFKSLSDEYVLCNLVNNNFVDSNLTMFDLIKSLDVAELQ